MVNENHKMLKEILDLQIVGMRMVDNLQEWKCVHEVPLNHLCDDCARDLSFRDQIEGK